jgi:phosphatidylserine decarboxylase
MKLRFAKEGWPFVLGSMGLFALLGAGTAAVGAVSAAWGCLLAGLLVTLGMLFFFRDPERAILAGPHEVLSGADGVVRSVEQLQETGYLGVPAVRISVFLSVFDVHVNRMPIAGRVESVAYAPGKHLFAFLDDASEYNEHSSVLVAGERIRCLVRQIVGPVARRVVCRKKPGDQLAAGERFGIMKFGSRLDVYLPAAEVTVLVKKGDRVVAGQTVIATLKVERIT